MAADSLDFVETKINLIKNSELFETKCRLLIPLLIEINKKDVFKQILSKVEVELISKNQTSHKNTGDAVHWIREKMLLLTNSKWKNHPNVKDTFKTANAIIFCKKFPKEIKSNRLLYEYTQRYLVQPTYCNQTSFLGCSVNALYHLTHLISQFGEAELFEGWTQLDYCNIELNLKERFSSPDEIKKMNISHLSHAVGFGFKTFTINRLDNSTIDFQLGIITKIFYPPFIDVFFEKYSSHTLNNWKNSRDLDLTTAYQYIKIFSEYDRYMGMDLSKLDMFPTWEKHELFDVNLSIKNFFSSSKRRPEEVDQILTTFLLLLKNEAIKANFNKPSKRRYKNEAKAYVHKKILKIYEETSEDELTVDELYNQIMRSSQGDFKSEITLNLVRRVSKEILNSNGKTRKGGRPPRKT